MLRTYAASIATLIVSVPACAGALPSCAGPVEISGGHLLRVEQNGAIVLTDGRAVHLEGIRLPQGPLDRAPQAFSAQALLSIKSLAGSTPLTLTSIPPKEDRYDRIRVQAFAGDGWIQYDLLGQGLARVSIAPDRMECAADLLASETRARSAHAGIWASPAYAIRSPQNLWPDLGTFQIVEGRVLNAIKRNGRAYLNFGSDWRTDFTVTVDADDIANFRKFGVDPMSYVGQTIRVRGLVQSLNGPEIEVPNPQSIEVLK